MLGISSVFSHFFLGSAAIFTLHQTNIGYLSIHDVPYETTILYSILGIMVFGFGVLEAAYNVVSAFQDCTSLPFSITHFLRNYGFRQETMFVPIFTSVLLFLGLEASYLELTTIHKICALWGLAYFTLQSLNSNWWCVISAVFFLLGNAYKYHFGDILIFTALDVFNYFYIGHIICTLFCETGSGIKTSSQPRQSQHSNPENTAAN